MSSFVNSFQIRSSPPTVQIYPEITQHQRQEQSNKSNKSLLSSTRLPFSALNTSSSPSKQRKIETLPINEGAGLMAQRVELFTQTNIAQTLSLPSSSLGLNTQLVPSSPTARIDRTPPSSPVRNFSSFRKAPKTPDCNPRRNITSRFVLTALHIIDEMRIDTDMQIIPMIGMHGEHSQVYQVHSERSLIPGVSNDDIYIKLFQEEVLRKNGNAVEKEFLTNILTQYNEIRSAGIRVVNIFNVDTASTDGYLVVEKLAPFMIPWDASTKLSDLSAENKAHLDYLTTLFRFGLTNPSEVSLDIHRGNFGLDQGGNLVLLDLMEDTDDFPYAFRLYAKNHALSLSNGSDEIYTLFKEAIRDIAPQVYILLFDES